MINYYLLRQRDTMTPSSTFGYTRLKEDGTASSWAIWAVMPAYQDDPRTLRITSFGHYRLLEDVQTLIAAASAEARAQNCERISIWGMEEEARRVLLDRLGGSAKVIKRKEHLGCLAWYGEGKAEDVKWVGGEE